MVLILSSQKFFFNFENYKPPSYPTLPTEERFFRVYFFYSGQEILYWVQGSPVEGLGKKKSYSVRLLGNLLGKHQGYKLIQRSFFKLYIEHSFYYPSFHMFQNLNQNVTYNLLQPPPSLITNIFLKKKDNNIQNISSIYISDGPIISRKTSYIYITYIYEK